MPLKEAARGYKIFNAKSELPRKLTQLETRP